MNSISNLRSLFLLMAGIFLITSCLEMGKEDIEPTDLYGKWRLVRVEETVKTVSPPAPTPNIWIEFRKSPANNGAQGNLPYTFNGEGMVNAYSGSFDADGKLLKVSEVAATERGGEAAAMRFDDYYFSKLRDAVSYYIHENNQTLVVETKDKHLLIFVRYDNEG